MATKSSGSSPDKRHKYDEAFKAEALRLAGESRSTQAAARQLGRTYPVGHQPQADLPLAAGPVRGRSGQRRSGARPGGGWRYLAVWLDRCSRKIVGWDVRDTMPEDLVNEALRRALVVRRPPAGLIVHSNQGSQYTATRFKNLLARHGAQQSMSRRGNYYDNALPGTTHAKSFWSRFKAELLDGGRFPGLEEAMLEISHHIAYYNAERRHSALSYLAPNHFETHLQTTSQLCPA